MHVRKDTLADIKRDADTDLKQWIIMTDTLGDIMRELQIQTLDSG